MLSCCNQLRVHMTEHHVTNELCPEHRLEIIVQYQLNHVGFQNKIHLKEKVVAWVV